MDTLPTVHLNGTSAKDLFEGWKNFMEKLEDALEEAKKIEFNARDYYVQGNHAWPAAHDEFRAMLVAINDAKEKALAVCIHVQDIMLRK